MNNYTLSLKNNMKQIVNNIKCFFGVHDYTLMIHIRAYGGWHYAKSCSNCTYCPLIRKRILGDDYRG